MNIFKDNLENMIEQQIDGIKEIHKSRPRHLRWSKIEKLEAEINSKLYGKYGLSLNLPMIFRGSVVFEINDQKNDFENIEFYKKLKQVAEKNSSILKTREYFIAGMYISQTVKRYRFTKSPLLFAPAILTLDPCISRDGSSFLGIHSKYDLIKVKRTNEGYQLLESILNDVYKKEI